MAITPLPTPPNSVTRAATFNADTDAFLGALPQFVSEANALQSTLAAYGRNMLINAGFAISQWGLPNPADDQYFIDRWYALTQTASVNSSVLGPSIESGFNYGIRLTQNQAAAQRFGFAQIVEDWNCRHMIGNTATMAGRVRCSAATNIRYAILGNTGSANVVTSDFVNSWTSTNYTASNFFAASGCRVFAVGQQAVAANTWTQLAAISAAITAGVTNLMVFVWTESAMAQNVTLDCDYVQLENGAFATPFEQRNSNLELTLCQRYAHRRVFGSNVQIAQIAMASGSTGAGILYNLPVQPRAAPTVTVVGGYLLLNPGQSGNSAFSSTSTTCDASGNVAFFGTNLASLWSSGQAAILFAGGSTCDIFCTMEL